MSYRCKTFEAYIGLADSSKSGAGANFSVLLDRDETALGDKGLGTATKVSIDTSGRRRLELQVLHYQDGATDTSGFASARVLCAGKP